MSKAKKSRPPSRSTDRKGPPEGEYNPVLQAAILEAVDNQLNHSNPPEVKLTFDRLRSQGFSVEQTRHLIGAVLVSEVFEVLKHNQPYDEVRYVAALRRLPAMPWE